MALLASQLLLASSFVSTALGAVHPHSFKKSNVVPGGFIVEWQGDSLIDPKNGFYQDLSNKKIQATHRQDFQSNIFKGVSFHVDAGLDMDTLAKDINSMSGVKEIWPIHLYDTQDLAKRSPYALANDTSSNSTRYSTLVQGGVDKLHAEGLSGEGKFVAVIDTGVDYLHPALGGCFGPGCKVAYGYDLVGDDYNGANTPVPDDDPYADCNGGEHGTHVSGIVGAMPNEDGYLGVAPKVTLGSYRVFGCSGSASDDVLIAAFTKAFEDGADIITASIGGVNGWTEEAWSVAVSRIVAAGTPCTLAAGNDGSEGMFFGSSAADGVGVIAVGSVDNIDLPIISTLGSYTVDGAASGQFNYQDSSVPLPNISLPLTALTFDTSIVDDACNPLPEDTPDLSGKLVLIRRGTCTYSTKGINAVARGAQYIMFYNNAGGLVSASIPDVPGLLGAAMVSSVQGPEWVAAIQAGSEVVVTITGLETAFSSSPNNVTGGYMSTFSEWYPTNEVYIKPEISAPGGNILNTLPLSQGGRGILSGTSMATPYIAGVIALLLEARPDLTPQEIRSILGTTGKPLNFNDGTTTFPFLAPVVQQGGGDVNAYLAVHTSTVFSVPNLSFNDTEHFVPEANFTLTNRGTEEITYEFSYKNAATGYTLPEGSSYPQGFPVDLLPEAGASLSFSESTLTLAPGASADVLVTLTPPADLSAQRIPVYSGFIGLSASNGETLHLPYAGVASNLRDAVVQDQSETGFPYISATAGGSAVPAANGTVFIIPATNGTGTTYPTNGSVVAAPNLRIGLTMASAYISAELVSVGGAYGNGTLSLGQIAGSPIVYQPRGVAFEQRFYGSLADGSKVPEGTYKIVVKALRIFGDREDEKDYDVEETTAFTIKYGR